MMYANKFYASRLLTVVPYLNIVEKYKCADPELDLTNTIGFQETLYDIFNSRLNPPIIETIVEDDPTPRVHNLGFYGTPSEQITLV